MSIIIKNYEQLKKELEGKTIPEFEVNTKKPYLNNTFEDYKDSTVWSKEYSVKDIRKELKEFRKIGDSISQKIIDIILDNIALLRKVKFIGDRSYFAISALLVERSIGNISHIDVDMYSVEYAITPYEYGTKSYSELPHIDDLSIENELDLIMNHYENFYISFKKGFNCGFPIFPHGEYIRNRIPYIRL